MTSHEFDSSVPSIGNRDSYSVARHTVTAGCDSLGPATNTSALFFITMSKSYDPELSLIKKSDGIWLKIEPDNTGLSGAILLLPARTARGTKRLKKTIVERALLAVLKNQNQEDWHGPDIERA